VSQFLVPRELGGEIQKKPHGPGLTGIAGLHLELPGIDTMPVAPDAHGQRAGNRGIQVRERGTGGNDLLDARKLHA